MANCSVESFMTTNVLSIEPDTSLNNITQLMSNNKLSCLIVQANQKPVGIITERDIVSILNQALSGQQDLKTLTTDFSASDLMSHNLITVDKNKTLSEALIQCVVNSVRHLPVTDENHKLCGIITYTDIANELLETNQQLEDLSLIDPLTGIGNRRAMEIELKTVHSLSRRYENDYSVMMLDIDYFKKYNDHYGHQQGDKALHEVACCLKECLRESDRLFRYGGEEFIIVLPQTDRSGAICISQRILDSLREQKIPHSESPKKIVTVSCGVSVYSRVSPDIKWNELVKQADDALYHAKHDGRDQVSVSAG